LSDEEVGRNEDTGIAGVHSGDAGRMSAPIGLADVPGSDRRNRGFLGSLGDGRCSEAA
jgi:hypothetical protein